MEEQLQTNCNEAEVKPLVEKPKSNRGRKKGTIFPQGYRRDKIIQPQQPTENIKENK